MIKKLSSFLHYPLFSLGYFVKEIENIFFVFLSSYRNKSGGLGERECFGNTSRRQVFPQLFRVNTENVFYFLNNDAHATINLLRQTQHTLHQYTENTKCWQNGKKRGLVGNITFSLPSAHVLPVSLSMVQSSSVSRCPEQAERIKPWSMNRTWTYQHSFFIRASRIWNSLPTYIRDNSLSLASLKNKLFKYYTNALLNIYNPDNPKTWKSVCSKCNVARALVKDLTCCF